MSAAGRGESFRRRTILEALARALPRGWPFDAVRHRLRSGYERMLSPGSGALRSVLPGGEVVLVAPEHRHMTWNLDEYHAFRACVRPGDVVIDAGANVGCYSVLFGQWVGAAGRVYAFEPDPRAFEGLTRHVSLNGLDGRVIPVAQAMSDRSRVAMPFTLAPSLGVSRLAAAQPESGIAVRATSIDDFCAEARIHPNVIKVDVEGAELDVLRGARETIASRGHDLHLFVEMHPGLWRSLDIGVDDLRRECAAQRLAAEPLPGDDGNAWSREGVSVRLRRVA